MDGGGVGVASWPSLEVNIEPFRVVLPNSDHTHFLLLGVGGVTMTSSLDYAGPDVRYITDSSAFRRLSLLSSERKQPALPAYQLEALSLSMWGVHNTTTRYSCAWNNLISNQKTWVGFNPTWMNMINFLPLSYCSCSSGLGKICSICTIYWPSQLPA